MSAVTTTQRADPSMTQMPGASTIGVLARASTISAHARLPDNPSSSLFPAALDLGWRVPSSSLHVVPIPRPCVLLLLLRSAGSTYARALSFLLILLPCIILASYRLSSLSFKIPSLSLLLGFTLSSLAVLVLALTPRYRSLSSYSLCAARSLSPRLFV